MRKDCEKNSLHSHHLEQLINILVFAAILQGLFLSSIYFFSKKYGHLSNRVLAFFLLALMVEAVNSFLPPDYIGEYSIGTYFGLPESKLFFPVLFWHYVLLTLNRAKKYWRSLFVGYSIAFLVVGITLVNLVLFLFVGKELSEYVGWDVMDTMFMTQQLLAYGECAIVLFLSLRELKRHTHIAKNKYSDIGLLQLQWLRQFIYLMIPIVILWGLELLRIAFGEVDPLSDIVIFTWFVLFALIYFITYKAFTRRDLFETTELLDEESDKKGPKEEEIIERAFMDRLDQFMEEQRSYQQPNLKLYELAEATGISPRKISTAIHTWHHTNFSDWVNRYRVEHAKKLLRKDSQFTIEGIGLESGFKSRSTMYLAFKNITGKSPGEFK